MPRTRLFAGRDPLPFETSMMGVFAVGDVRHGSLKRVAAAVGEGSSAVRSGARAPDHEHVIRHAPAWRGRRPLVGVVGASQVPFAP